jgi:two-component system, cell cycle sensor histidine kinase and response regulator CckA
MRFSMDFPREISWPLFFSGFEWPMSETPQILILDFPETGRRLRSVLNGQGWVIHGPWGIEEYRDQCKSCAVDVALVNAGSEELDPSAALDEVIRQGPDTRIIVVADYSSIDRAIDALRRGAHDYVLRPFARAALLKSIENAVAQKRMIVGERRRAEGELTELKEDLERLVNERTLHILEANARLQKDVDALKKEGATFRSLFETSREAMFIKDPNLKYTVVNPAMESLFGLEGAEWVGKTDVDLFGKETAKLMEEFDHRTLGGKIAKKDQVIPVKGVQTTFHLTRLPLRDESGNVTGLWGTARDMTETKRLERQFQAAQRMESVGTLAGGIAHNFNNLLMGILGTVSLLLMDMDPGDAKYRKLKKVEEYVRNGVDLTRQLLGFARGGKYEAAVLDLNEIVEKTAAVFSQTKKEIIIHREWEPRLWPVKGDAGQIEQVLLNLYVNAWQAMPGGGDLYVKTENILLDRSYVRDYTVEPGRYVQVSVRDTGIGMDLETQQRIFEPFFTTRGVGKGTGLGLAAVYGIVKNHRGFIHASSEKGLGATFEILFPAFEEEEKDIGEDTLVGPQKGKPKGTVLLVDDEEMVASVGKDLLEALGYEPLVARTGEEAVHTYREKMDRIDLVILDMIMPGMSGGETYGRLREINPAVRVLLSSGYSMNGEAEKILQSGCYGFIQKPYSMRDLSVKLRSALA